MPPTFRIRPAGVDDFADRSGKASGLRQVGSQACMQCRRRPALRQSG